MCTCVCLRVQIRRGGGRQHQHHPKQEQQQEQADGPASSSPPPPSSAVDKDGTKPAAALLSVRGHHAPVFGWLCLALGVSEPTADRMFLYLVLRDVLAAATRYGWWSSFLSRF